MHLLAIASMLVAARTCFSLDLLDNVIKNKDTVNIQNNITSGDITSNRTEDIRIIRDGALPQNGSDCFTPQGQLGSCIEISSCQTLIDLLSSSVTPWKKAYVRNSICDMKNFMVCCGSSPKPPNNSKPSQQRCKSKVSAFPPDPFSGCCGIDNSLVTKIVGGTATGLYDYPWMVQIEYLTNATTEFKCDGILISGRYVLTAAHCFNDDMTQGAKSTHVILGEYDTTSDPDCVIVEGGGVDCADKIVRIAIEEIIVHSLFRGGKNDIALIRLKEIAPFTDFIRPICLPTVDITKLPANQTDMLFVAGWGATDTEKRSTVKMHVDVPYVPRELCQPKYDNVNLWEKQICAGGVTGKDSCTGDSGGPLMYENRRTFELIGIVSFGSPVCGATGVPAIYTHVLMYNDWIRKQIRP